MHSRITRADKEEETGLFLVSYTPPSSS